MTGGVAVEYRLAMAGRRGLRERLADLDFVARRVGVLARAIPREFLVSHYHAAGPGVPKALLQLVDPLARLRVDVFPVAAGALARATRGTLGGTSLLVLDARSMLEHKLRTLRRSSATDPADPKHWRDAAALAELCGCEPPAPPPHLRPAVLSTDIHASCARCELSRDPGVPLAPKREIFAILGYV